MDLNLGNVNGRREKHKYPSVQIPLSQGAAEGERASHAALSRLLYMYCAVPWKQTTLYPAHDKNKTPLRKKYCYS